MSILGVEILPDVADRPVPFWRQCLRGLSNCAFQVNEFTGLLFVLAVGLYSWHMAIYYVVSVIIATVVAHVAKGVRGLYTDLMGVFLDIGLLGFNSALMGLALGNFFHRGTALYVAVVVLAVVVEIVNLILAKWLPFPFLAAPFILTFWVFWPISSHVGVHAISLGAFADEPVHYIQATFFSLGSTLFSAKIVSGVLFLVGVLVSNWRHAVVAAMSGLVAVALAQHVHVVGGAVNTGFIGFNAVLAGVATYALVAQDLRLALLATFLATWLFSFVTRNAPAPALASGFVLGVWAILLLGWINPRFVGQQPPAEAEPPPGSEAPPRAEAPPESRSTLGS
jgi:urea transporter